MSPLPAVASMQMGMPCSDDGVAADAEIAAAAGFQPPVFGRNEDSRHLRTFDAVSADFTVAGLDENAARAIETEVAVLNGKTIAGATGRTNHAAHRDVHLAVERERECLGQRARAAFKPASMRCWARKARSSSRMVPTDSTAKPWHRADAVRRK